MFLVKDYLQNNLKNSVNGDICRWPSIKITWAESIAEVPAQRSVLLLSIHLSSILPPLTPPTLPQTSNTIEKRLNRLL
jgi:hypothetical protein